MSGYSQALVAPAAPARSGAPAQTQVSLLAAMLLPSFGAVVFAVALLQVLFLSQGTRVLFRDSDAGWHIRVGEAIVAGNGVPHADPFSYTRGGQQWFAWEWLSDAVLGSAHGLWGLSGVAVLAALAIALTAWGAARLALALGGNFFFTATAAVLLLGATSIHWLARPHIFSWLLALAFVAVAERERIRPTPALYALPLLACLWANLHGSFPLGPAILLLYAVQAPRRRLLAASLASLLATFANPYGWRLHFHIAGYLQNTYLMDHISEFRSFSFHAPGAIYVEMFLLAAVAGMLAMVRQRAYGPALLSAAMLHLALYSARHLPTAAVVLLPLSVAALTREAERVPRLRAFLDYSNRVAAIDRKIFGAAPAAVALVAAALGVAVLARAGRVGFDPAKFPVQAAGFLESNGLQHRVFARDQWGGYLIYRFSGRMKVFVDGRSDFYGQDLLERYAQVIEVKPGWQAILDEAQVRFVLAPPGHMLASALRLSPQWKPAYADSVAAVFERVSPQ